MYTLIAVTVAEHSAFLNILQSGVLKMPFGCYMAGAGLNCCHLSTCSVYTINQFTSLYSKPHAYRVHVWLAVTCHLHFWQNDQDLLHAAVVTPGWNRYGNESQHKELTQEKKILPLSIASWIPSWSQKS